MNENNTNQEPKVLNKLHLTQNLIFLASFTLIAILVSFFSLNKYRELKDQKTPPPSTTTNTQIENIENWKTYTDPEGKFNFKYPSSYSLILDQNGTPTLNDRLVWFTTIKECEFGCGNIVSTVIDPDLKIDNEWAIRIKGKKKNNKGDALSYYLWRVSFPDSNRLLEFYLLSIPFNNYENSPGNDLETDTSPWQVQENGIQLLDSVVSTLKFNTRKNNTKPNTYNFYPVYTLNYPSEWIVNDNSNTPSFKSKTTDESVSVECVKGNKKELDQLMPTLEEDPNSNPGGYYTKYFENINVNGINGIQNVWGQYTNFNLGNNNLLCTSLINKNNLCKICTAQSEPKEKYSKEDVDRLTFYNQILSSFRFLD